MTSLRVSTSKLKKKQNCTICNNDTIKQIEDEVV